MTAPLSAADNSLTDKTILITGAARRVGLSLALAAAGAGMSVIIHYNHSQEEAQAACRQVQAAGVRAFLLQANLFNPDEAGQLVPRAVAAAGPLYALVNNASIFEPRKMADTTYQEWNQNLMIHLNAPFLLSQAFAGQVPPDGQGRIINILDWRALRPGSEHFAYNVSKASLAALTRASAAALAPHVSVNGLALGAILPPEGEPPSSSLIRHVPMQRWGDLSEVQEAFLFLLNGPAYITGEILHIDGGRQLV